MPADSSDDSEALPPYAGMMADYHEAFEAELRAVVSSLGIQVGDRVVDLACGDGSYTSWLAEEVGVSGKVLAVDLSSAFLDVAQRRLEPTGLSDRVQFIQLDVERPALVDSAADLVWCAQSLYSLPDPIQAVRRMTALAREGGRVAVFESDELHHVILPWPVDLELALRKAELDAFDRQSDRPEKYYVARDLPRVFREAGLPGCEVRSFAFCRRPPFDDATRGFLTAYIKNLRERTAPYLPDDVRRRVAQLADPASPTFMLDDPDALVVWVDHLAVSTRRGA